MNRVLFLDNEEIESMDGLRRNVNPPMLYSGNPVLKPEMPWEDALSHYGTVLYDEELEQFRFWYFSCVGRRPSPIRLNGREVPTNWSFLCYATSQDGINWERPNLGQVEFEGSTDNNIIRIGTGKIEGVAVMHEPGEADPQKRYKALYWNMDGPFITQADGAMTLGRDNNPHDGVCVAWSPDGLHWTDYDKNPVYTGSDTSHYLVKDPRGEKYLAYGRFNGVRFRDEWQRRVACIESRDFINWTKGVPVMEADHFDETTMPDTQIYGMTVDQYEGIFIGGVWMYHRGRDHTMDTQLALSRNGYSWARVGDNDFHKRPLGRDPVKEDVDRQVWLPLGPDGSGYSGMIRPAAKFITLGDTIYILVGLVEGRHSDDERNYKPPPTSIPWTVGLATLRRDGFVSLDSGETEGQVTSKPFVLPEGSLHLNVDASEGEFSAELIPEREANTPIAGSSQIVGDHLDVSVNWNEKGKVISGMPMRLRLRGRRAKFYSYWFESL